MVLRETLWLNKPKYFIEKTLTVHFVLSQGLLWRYKTNQKFKAVKKLSAVTESLLPFIKGPPRLKHVNRFFAAHLLNAKRYDKRSPQILRFLQSANFFKAEDFFSNNKLRIYKTVCPRCGSELVERTARKGPNAGSTFLGCENFPT